MTRLARLVLGLLALVLVGSAAAGPRDPRERHTQAGQAIARSAVLRRSDFARGWKPVSRWGRPFRCRGYNPDLSRLTRIGRARSAFSVPRAALVESNVSVYLDARQAATVFRVAATRAFLTCVTARYAKQLARLGPVRVTLKRMSAGPPLGTPSRTFRVGYLLRWHGHSLVYRYDATIFEVDDAIASVASWTVGGPYRYQTELVRRVASRL